MRCARGPDVGDAWPRGAAVNGVTPAHRAAAYLAHLVLSEDERAAEYATEILVSPVYDDVDVNHLCRRPGVSDVTKPAALVVLIDGQRTASAYVDGETCLNHVAQLATFVGADIHIAVSHGHTDAKWKGRGQR
jgi:hypothetical protein